MLAFASGTIEIIAGDSGAGERIPALAQEASRPGSPRSNMATFSPACASSNAMEEPMSPAPAIATSKDFMVRFYLIRAAHSADAFARVDRFPMARFAATLNQNLSRERWLNFAIYFLQMLSDALFYRFILLPLNFRSPGAATRLPERGRAVE